MASAVLVFGVAALAVLAVAAMTAQVTTPKLSDRQINQAIDDIAALPGKAADAISAAVQECEQMATKATAVVGLIVAAMTAETDEAAPESTSDSTPADTTGGGDEPPRRKKEKAKDRRRRQQEEAAKENPKKDGTPGNNQAQNKQFQDIVKRLKLNKDQARRLHEEITKKNLSRDEILSIGKNMFGK